MELTRNYITAEDWRKKYVPRNVFIDQKYQELIDDPASLARFLAKDIANNVRSELSKNR